MEDLIEALFETPFLPLQLIKEALRYSYVLNQINFGWSFKNFLMYITKHWFILINKLHFQQF